MAEKKMKIKTNSILEDYDVQWNQKLGTGISGPVRSRLLVVMELMDGGELFDRIGHHRHFTESNASRYTLQIAEAIERCHKLNVAHRDIKPENLLLKDNSDSALVKLSDFGFAKVDEGNLTTPHFTPYYVAPQVLEAQKDQMRSKYQIMGLGHKQPYTYDKSCDMWSLGVIVYILLCGYPPFYSEEPNKQITRNMKKKIMAGHYDFPREDWAHISDMAQDLVKKLLTVDPAGRLTVEGVLEHPWLKEAPLTILQSPAVLMDNKAMVQDLKDHHSEQLTSMRTPDNRVILKPMHQANNPILKKRAKPCPRIRNHSTQHSCEPPAKQTAVTPSNTDVFLCYADNTNWERKLKGLVQEACKQNVLNEPYQQLLLHWCWDGEQFNSPVDNQKFMRMLSDLIQQQSQPSPQREESEPVLTERKHLQKCSLKEKIPTPPLPANFDPS
ncbi:hypothetical protein CAPTEDRAFT_227750 [Capitella teleta]|uniref:non-specific serine/threonine protein kinase n=1 Tax=Capitella teleta TaxID=283909 RepID=R7UEA7_CAPTE|nr:hypothetical protein CAPTEDRAFT_227750 [Capitella teleta]|eukprot:ELU04869.1 hypothetical protein CAPTEDRAFT_227750 [Capitella teleta]